MGRHGAWMAGIAVIGLLTAGCDDGVDDAGASTLFQLRTGECFTSEAGTSSRTVELDDVTTLPCREAHDGEVFAVVTYPAARDVAYPGDDAVADFAASECLTRFQAYTGQAYDDSDLDVATVRPNSQSWDDRDDRDVGCVLYRTGGQLTGSRKAGGAG